MKYLCLVYLDQEHWSACPDPVCAAYGRQLADSKRLLAAEPLHPVHTATTVRVRNGQVQLYDGPFAETKELLAGFYLVDARDLNEAIQIASGIPPRSTAALRCGPSGSWSSATSHRSAPAPHRTEPKCDSARPSPRQSEALPRNPNPNEKERP